LALESGVKIERGNITDPVRLNGARMSSADGAHDLDPFNDSLEPDVRPSETPADAQLPWHRRSSVRTAFWVVVAATVMATTEMFKTFVSQEAQHHPVPLHALIQQNFPWWLSWAALVPVIFWLAKKYRLDDRERFFIRLPIHFVAAAVLSASHIVVSALLYFYSDFSYMPAQARQFLPKTPQAIVVRWLEAFLVMDMIVYPVVLGIYYVIDYQQRLRHEALISEQLRAQSAQLQHRMVEARLQALRMELNPHFLFNALNSVSALVRKKENSAAISMIASLGDLLRATLERGSDAEMPLGDEMRLVDLYMNIARVRFADRLKTVIDIPPELREAMVPTLALQPLVENAVRHGIGETERAVTITISAKQQEDSLVLQVSDTGPGIPDNGDGDTPEGIGLSNTRSRLAQLYGTNASLTVANVSSGGAVATIRMPLQMKRAELV
jgi:two-component system LytT family sensor kinase